jgi:iron-sulfur cluster repair protein YtfE (RIC family)
MSPCTCGCNHEATTATVALPRLTAETTVEELKRRPGALEVLQRFGINHCCGAHLPLREAAAAAGVRAADVLDALTGGGAQP